MSVEAVQKANEKIKRHDNERQNVYTDEERCLKVFGEVCGDAGGGRQCGVRERVLQVWAYEDK